MKTAADSSAPILVTGASGFLGRHIVPVLRERYGADRVVGVSSSDYDLTEQDQVRAMYRDIAPGRVVALAGYVGGIGANRDYPADFFYRNIVMNTLTIHEGWRAGAEKLLAVMGGCSYSATAPSPLREEQIWDGFPAAESAPYSMAKKMGLLQAAAYRAQYGFNAVVLVPGNVYGEYDNFELANSHVVPAMIRKFHEAALRREPRVVLWGSGSPTRDFVYAADVAGLFPWFLDRYDSSEPVNLSTGVSTSIRELAVLTAELTGYRGEIVWDTSQPDGKKYKIFAADRLHGLGLSCPTPLREGLEKTVRWFAEHYGRGDVRL
ncbi:MAG TPA: NAD-dependent epimerase/dehydratase family protein [bacterium]|nr:NAD-dependent epimerase/dehydratase family protein [bacterium]HPQ66601.1 NAD-dependent epimerase/dehydratase family protein [bacterium]